MFILISVYLLMYWEITSSLWFADIIAEAEANFEKRRKEKVGVSKFRCDVVWLNPLGAWREFWKLRCTVDSQQDHQPRG